MPVDGRKYGPSVARSWTSCDAIHPPWSRSRSTRPFSTWPARRRSTDAPQIARAISATIRSELELTASVGVASTKLVAKVASDLRKPDGLVVVASGTEADFLAPLPISRLWGVGEKTALVLAEIRRAHHRGPGCAARRRLRRRFGQQGLVLQQRARGIDPSPVSVGGAARSVSHEHTFDVDTNDWEVIERTLLALSEGVASRLRAGGVKARTVAVKVRDASFETLTRQRTLHEPTDQTETVFAAALELARPQFQGVRVRLLGVAASQLGDIEQLGLFDAADERRRRATLAADEIRQRYGSRAIRRARLLGSAVAEPFERDPMSAPEAGSIGRPESGDSTTSERSMPRDRRGGTDDEEGQGSAQVD